MHCCAAHIQLSLQSQDMIVVVSPVGHHRRARHMHCCAAHNNSSVRSAWIASLHLLLLPCRFHLQESVEQAARHDLDCVCVLDITVGPGTCTAVLPTTARLSDQHCMLHPGCYCSLVSSIFKHQLSRQQGMTSSCCLRDISVGPGTCTAVLPTTARLSDQQGMLHPGCYCSLVDLISTTALAAADKRPAVSVIISVDFFAALPIGEGLEIESHVVKTGKSLTFAEVHFRYSWSYKRFLYDT